MNCSPKTHSLLAGMFFLILFSWGCNNNDPVITDIDKKFDDVPGFDFKLPCPVADFSQDYLFASNVPRDGIPAINHPTFSSAGDVSWLGDDDRVLGVVFEGQPYAVPIRIMVWHEVLNIKGTAGNIAVTYCPLTFTGITFDLDKNFPGAVQSAGVSGLLYNSNLVIYDRKTGSFWTQMSGSSYGGPSAGECLDIVPTMDTTFRFWKELYPGTKVLDRPGRSDKWSKYNINTYANYWATEDIFYPVPLPLDSRLPNKEWVHGVLADTGAKVFPMGSGLVVNDSLPGVPFVVFTKKLEKTQAAYKAWVDDGIRLNFSSAGSVGGIPLYTDDVTGSTWNFKGECTAGPLAGSFLERMPSYLSFFFAWSAYFPGTEIHVP